MITRQAIATALSMIVATHAYAQASYPNHAIKVILPYTAASPIDVSARIIAPALAARLGEPAVVENRAGGGTAIGLKAVMTASPDGYTLLYTNSPTHVIAQLLAKGFSYDPIKDFVPIVMVGSTSLVLVVASDLPANTLQAFIAYAKAHPGELNFGFGQGTLPQLVGEAFKMATGTEITSIPYRGGAAAVTDMLGGRIHMGLSAVGNLLPLIRDGKIKALAVTSPARNPELPDVPTMIESGLPTLTSVTHYGFLGPAGTSANVVARINDDVNECLKAPELRAALLRAGFEPVGGSPRDFAAVIADQLQHWAPIVRASGFQMD